MPGMRGSKPFGSITKQTIDPSTISITGVNDLFLHALFARLAFYDNTVVELRTVFDGTTVELDVPDRLNDVFDQLTGLQRGENLKTFIGWLVGNLDYTGRVLESTDGTYDLGSGDVCVLEHTLSGHTETHISITTRIRVGSNATPVVDGSYILHFYINDNEVLPTSNITVSNNGDVIMFQSKLVTAESDADIKICLSGPSGSQDVECILSTVN